MAKGMNWDKVAREGKVTRADANRRAPDLREAFRVLSFFLREKDIDSRVFVAVPYEWNEMSADTLAPYFKAHWKIDCPELKALKDKHWIKISVATAESVQIQGCEVCERFRSRF